MEFETLITLIATRAATYIPYDIVLQLSVLLNIYTRNVAIYLAGASLKKPANSKAYNDWLL